MRFEDAVAATPLLKSAFCKGKTALKAPHSAQVMSKATRRFSGSVDVDASLSPVPEHGAEPRWDYGIGYRIGRDGEYAIWIEIHPAATSEVRTVLGKLEWLKRFLREEAIELDAITPRKGDPVDPFVWLATQSGTHIPETSPQARALRQAGLRLPRRTIQLPDV